MGIYRFYHEDLTSAADLEKQLWLSHSNALLTTTTISLEPLMTKHDENAFQPVTLTLDSLEVKPLVRPLTLDSVVQFTWGFGCRFLLGPDEHDQYWVWSDPEYGGDNTIRRYLGNPRDFTTPGFCGRHKGTHRVGDYCGSDAKVVL